MKKESPRWTQTQTLTDQAEAQTEMANAAKGLHLGFTSRQVYAKINQIQYGFDQTGSLSMISFGNTGLIGSYSVYDRFSKERIALAEKNQEMNSAQKEQYQSDLTYLMLIQYLNLARLGKKLGNIELNLRRDEEIVKAAHQKVAVGAGVRLDLLRARNLMEYEKIKKLDIEAQIDKAKSDLALTLGREKLDREVAALRFQPYSIPADKTIYFNRKDLQVSEKTLELARQNKILNDVDGSPKILLFGEAGLSGTTIAGGSNQALTGSVGAQLTLPLYDSGYATAKRHEAQVNIMKAEMQQRQLKTEVSMQIEGSIRQLENAQKAYVLSEKQIEAAEEETDLAQKRFHSGAAAGLELANAQSNLANARDMSIDALFGHEAAKLNYFRSIGKLDDYLKEDGSHE